MARSLVTVDLAAIRHNAGRLRELLTGAELWAVVKADAYGHGIGDVAPAALAGGASALCVATVGEALALRRIVPTARIVVLGPSHPDEHRAAREAGLELVVTAAGRLPVGLPLHVKLDTGMGRWGVRELAPPGGDVVGLMTHLACADSDPAFSRLQLERFLEATADHSDLVRHSANSAAAIGLPEARLDAARCGIALYGIDPFGENAAHHGLRPALRWESEVARVVELRAGESTGYGRRFVATAPTTIGLVPVGYADGFTRDLTGTRVLVEGLPCEVVGTISMDAFAVRLARPVEPGTPVTLVGDGATLERHARIAGTIAYELACGIRTDPVRSVRMVVG
jgi:alanine racemase